MNKKRLTLIIAFMAACFGALAASTESLNQRLHSLRSELLRDYKQMAVTKEKISDKYELQHQKMIGIIKKCDALSLRLYSQKQEYTLDLCFALEQVKDEYEAFNKDRLPYDRVVSSLDIEIDRCARLIEALRRLPPEKQHVRNLHDSLAYHNDSLDQYCRANQDWHFNPSEDSRVLGLPETVLFKLDKEGERNRDTCLYFATELLKIQVQVAYGTDIQHVREVLEEAMQVMRTKDPYGREVVEPSKGVYVVLGDFGESGVEIWVKQYILAAERIGYIDRAKEVIYNALNANGIAIPFPQCDIHVINDETPNFSEASPQ